MAGILLGRSLLNFAKTVLAYALSIQAAIVIFANTLSLGFPMSVSLSILWVVAGTMTFWSLRSRPGVAVLLLILSGFLCQRVLLSCIFWLACLRGDCI